MQINKKEIGNSKVIVISKPMLTKVGLEGQSMVNVTIENRAIILRRPSKALRTRWVEAAQAVNATDGDVLVMGEFANSEDKNLD